VNRGGKVAESESPLAQFTVRKIVDLHIGGFDVSFTNASLFMVIAAALITLFMVTAMRPRAIVPGRFQGAAEMFYEFVDTMLVENVGVEGRRYFPFVFSIFMFVFFCNFLGLMPIGLAESGFTVTSHIIVTFALAIMVFVVVTIIGFARHGFHFLRLFVPSGVPWPILPILVPIEIMSY
jgi:F-type H+-transporting ATPase subunit a